MPQSAGALYLRVSSDEQSEADRSGLPVQRAACLALAEQDGVPVVAEFEDTVSGRTLDRPALADLLARLPEFSHVYALDATRLGRKRAVSQAVRDAFREAGVVLRLVHGGSSEADAEGGVILDAVGDALSEVEIMRLARRVQGGREARARRGLPAGKLPVGWQTVRDNRGRSIGAEFDESCRAFYDDLERLVLSGVSWNEVVREIHDLGHLSPYSGKQWPRFSLRMLAANPWNRGCASFGVRRVGKGRIIPAGEQIVTPNGHGPVWRDPEGMLAELARRSKLSGRGRWRVARFAGLLRCSGCGRRLVYRRNGEKARYKCTKHAEARARISADGCPSPASISEKTIADMLALFFAVAKVTGPEWTLQAIRAAGRTQDAPDVDAMRAREGKLTSEIERLAARLGNVAEGAVPAVQERLAVLSDERETLRQTIRKAGTIPEPATGQLEGAAETFDRLLTASPAECSAWLSRLFPRGIRVVGTRRLELPTEAPLLAALTQVTEAEATDLMRASGASERRIRAWVKKAKEQREARET